MNNEKGMSLVEVMVAAAVSIVVAMGVMKINESSQKGFKSIELKSELGGVRNKIQGLLMSQPKCSGDTAGHETLMNFDMSAATSNDGIFSPTDNTFRNYLPINRLEIVTGPGPDGMYISPPPSGAGPWPEADDNTSILLEMTADPNNGPTVPGAPNWYISQSMRFYPYGANNVAAPVNRCVLMIPVAKRTAADKSSIGTERKMIWFELDCDIQGNTLVSCSSMDSVASGLLQDNGDGSWGTDQNLFFTGKVQVDTIPGGAYDQTTVANGSFRVKGNQVWRFGANHAIELPSMQALSFGDGNETGIYHDNADFRLDISNMDGTEGDILMRASDNIKVDAQNGVSIIANASDLDLLNGGTGAGRVVISGNQSVDIGTVNNTAPINLTGAIDSDINLMTRGTGSIHFTASGPVGNILMIAGGNAGNIQINTSGGNLNLDAPGTGNTTVRAGQVMAISGAQVGISSLTGDISFSANNGNSDFIVNAADFRVNAAGAVTASSSITAGGNIITTQNLNARFDVAGSSFTFHPSATSGANLSYNGTRIVSSRGIQAPGFFNVSDERYKDNIETIQNASDTIEQLRGVTYIFRQDEFPEMKFDKNLHYGFIAQEVEKVLPALVAQDKAGYKSVEYANMVAVLVEAFKEQNQKVKTLEDENKMLKSKHQEVLDKLERIEQRLLKMEQHENM